MGASCGIDKDGTLAPRREVQITLAERGGEGGTGIGNSPCVEGGHADVGYGDVGALGLSALGRGLGGDGTATFMKTCGFHRGGNVVASLFPEGGDDGLIVLASGPRETAFEFDDPAYFFSARVLMTQVGDAAGGPNEGIDQVVMRAAVLDVLDAASRYILQAEFTFVVRHENLHDGVSVTAGRRIDMKMMDRSVSSSVRGRGDELSNLFREGGGAEMSGVEYTDGLPSFRRKEVAGEGLPSGSPRRPRYHQAFTRFLRPVTT